MIDARPENRAVVLPRKLRNGHERPGDRLDLRAAETGDLTRYPVLSVEKDGPDIRGSRRFDRIGPPVERIDASAFRGGR